MILGCLGILLFGIGFFNDRLSVFPDSIGRLILTVTGQEIPADHAAGKSTQEMEDKNLEGKISPPEPQIDVEVKEDLNGGTSQKDDFFANYRLERERVRAQMVEMLNSVISDPNSDAASRKDAQKKLMDISDHMERELQLENLIKAKGYDEAAMFIQSGSATAILKKDGMMEEDVSAVADIISRVTGYNLEDIVVIPK